MSEPGTPWWYSGGGEEPEPKPDGPGLPNLDWTALASGAQRLVDWATEKVMAPHSEHTDPREHPQCVVCRTMLLLGDRAPAGDQGPSPSAQPPDDITWIPIMGESPEA